MSDAREDNDSTAAERDDALAGGAFVSQSADAQPAAADSPLMDAEMVSDAAATAAGDSAVELVEAEVLEEGAADSDESEKQKRPSANGHLAKPKKKKGKGPHARKPVNTKRVRRVICGIIVALLVAALVGTGLFCWQKWMRFDDAADIQGVWKVQSTGDTIVFDNRSLKLTRGISYEYKLDASEKTITYSFGDLVGGGHYYFSADRQALIIVDGDERLDAFAEIGFLPDALVGNDDATDNKTVLSKVSNDTSAEPSGTATGVAAGAASGEREYVLKPEPSSSSSSGDNKSSRSSGDDDEDLNEEHRGFVDQDGDGYDDDTDLDYESFMDEYGQNDEDSEDADEEERDSADEEDGGEDEAYLDEEYEDAGYDENE